MRYSAILLSCISACSADAIDVVYDPCSPLTVLVVPGTDEREIRSVEEAVQAWSRVIPTQIDVVPQTRRAAGLSVVFENETFYRAMYWDSQGEISIGRDKLGADDYAVAIAHELGHAFGLQHVAKDERPSVMNVGNLETVPNEQDGAALRALWEMCAVEPAKHPT